jgi:predicted transposase/invertase (TIGR01784 family)
MCKINPKIDIVFKKLFGVDKNKDLLKSLINSVLPVNEQLTEITLKNPYNYPDYVKGKLSILDIKATDEKKRHYNVEMQIIGHDDYGKRTLYYWAKTYAEQLQESAKFVQLNKTIVISILDFSYFKQDNEYHRIIELLDKKTNQKYPELDYLALHFVELEKYQNDIYNIKSTLERWITFLNKAHEIKKNNIPKELLTPEIEKAVEELEVMHLDEKEREQYEGQQIFLMDEKARLDSAEKKGKIEGKIEAAEKGILAGLTDEIIKTITDLPLEQIKELRNKLTNR